MKSTGSSYVQNMIENMILTSYSDKSYHVATSGGSVVGVQKISRDKLKHEVGQHLLWHNKFILSYDMTFMLRWKLHHTLTVNHVDAAIAAF